jgi:hypothetical protein
MLAYEYVTCRVLESAIRYFRLPVQLLRLALVDPTDRYLKGVEAPFRHARSLINNACFPTSFLSLSLSPNGRLLHHHGETKSYG